MNKKMLAVVPAVAALVLGPLAGTATADGDGGGGLPRHGHMLVLGVQYDETGEPSGYRKCVDLAGGNWLPLKAHHSSVHTGNAGMALSEKAGHMAVPTAPLSPIRDCAHLAELLAAGML